MIEKTLKLAWKKYKSSWVKFLIFYIVSGAIVIGLYALGLLGAILAGVNDFKNLPTFLIVLLLPLLAFIAILLRSVFLSLVSNPGKTLKTHINRGWKKLPTLIAATVIVAGVFALVGLLWAVLAFAVPSSKIIVSVVLGVLMIYMSVRMAFIAPEIFVSNSTAIESIKNSWRKTGRCFWTIILMWICGFAISLALAYIPIIGGIIISVVVNPVATLWLFEVYRAVK